MRPPILLQEVLDALELQPGKVVADLTVGMGGHASAIAERVGPKGMVIGVDCDAEAIAVAEERLKGVDGRYQLFHRSFLDIASILKTAGFDKVHGILLDLGLSNLAVDRPERGFSFRHDGPLDMRMDRSQDRTAADVVNELSEKQLEDLLREYGEERHARKVARAICGARKHTRISSTQQLADIVVRAVPSRHGRLHAATRTFQSLRIATNNEIEKLRLLLEQVERYLFPGARLLAISFHSLEDRVVKTVLRRKEAEGVYEVLSRKPIRPTREEVARNGRSRSAKLRAAVRV